MRAILVMLALALLAGCAGLSQKGGFSLQGKPKEGTEAPWHNRAIRGDVKALQCVEAIPVLMSRDPAWQIERQDVRRTYEREGKTVPIERLVQRAVVYTRLGVRYFEAVVDDETGLGYNILMPCGTVKLLFEGSEYAFAISSDESRLITLDGRLLWLAKGQQPGGLTRELLIETNSRVQGFMTFRRSEAVGQQFLKRLEANFPGPAEVDGVFYSVTTDFVQVARLTSGQQGLDCTISEGRLPVNLLGFATTVVQNVLLAPHNVKKARGDCYRLSPPQPKEVAPTDLGADPEKVSEAP